MRPGANFMMRTAYGAHNPCTWVTEIPWTCMCAETGHRRGVAYASVSLRGIHGMRMQCEASRIHCALGAVVEEFSLVISCSYDPTGTDRLLRMAPFGCGCRLNGRCVCFPFTSESLFHAKALRLFAHAWLQSLWHAIGI